MKDKCEQQTRIEVGRATISMARDLKKSERFGTLLQSKLSKAEVISPYTTSLFHFKLKALCHCQIKVSNLKYKFLDHM